MRFSLVNLLFAASSLVYAMETAPTNNIRIEMPAAHATTRSLVHPSRWSAIKRSLSQDTSREAMLQHLIAALGSEYLGTTLFSALLYGSVNTLNTGNLSPEQNKLYNALAVGFALTVAARPFGNGLFNPGISIAKLTVGDISPLRAVFLTIAQYSGALTGAGIIKLLTGTLRTLPTIATGTSVGRAFALELIFNAAFIFSVLMITSKKHAANQFASIEVGLALFINALVTIGYTSASLNGALAFASDAVSHQFPEHSWIYQVANYAAGLGAGSIYLFLGQLALLQKNIDPDPATGIALAVDQVTSQMSYPRRRSMSIITHRSGVPDEDIEDSATLTELP